jgi:hypothetical protein
VAHTLNDLQQAAYLIVLEASRRSNAPTTYVRRELVTMLEAALRKDGVNVDSGLRHMRAWRKKEKVESDARIAAAQQEQDTPEAKERRRQAYRDYLDKKRSLP